MTWSENNRQLRETGFDEIDFTDNTFKFSRNAHSDSLLQSVNRHGILAPPVLFYQQPAFTIIIGHNRLAMARRCGFKNCDCEILQRLDTHSIIKYTLLKAFHGGIGPIGKIKFISALIKLENGVNDDIRRIARQEMGIPDFFLSSTQSMKKVLSLPQPLKDYLDSRDPGFKTLRDLVRLQDNALDAINSWVATTQFRVNIFRDCIDCLYDIQRRDGTTDLAMNIDPSEYEDNRAREHYIFQSLRKLRYPEYSRMSESAEFLIGGYRKKGIIIKMPPYFEGDRIEITIELSKKEGLASLQNKIKELDFQGLRTLLNFL